MRTIIAVIIINVLLASSAFARDTRSDFSLADVMASQKAKEVLSGDVAFFFGEQAHPDLANNLSEVRANKKTNAFMKSDRTACEWVFLSAMKALEAVAIHKGGNAVVNIRSNYKNEVISSSETFRCGAGMLIAGVALIGDVVTLK